MFKAGDIVAYQDSCGVFRESIIIKQHKIAPYLWLVRWYGGSEQYVDVDCLRPAD